MNCKKVAFHKATSSGESGCVEVAFHAVATSQGGNCVEVGLHPAESRFAKASASGEGGCVEVDSAAGCGNIHVRDSRFPGRVVDVPEANWAKRVRKTGPTSRVRLWVWFPWWKYGGFARTFTEDERLAFEDGIRRREPQLVGTLV